MSSLFQREEVAIASLMLLILTKGCMSV